MVEVESKREQEGRERGGERLREALGVLVQEVKKTYDIALFQQLVTTFHGGREREGERERARERDREKRRCDLIFLSTVEDDSVWRVNADAQKKREIVTLRERLKRSKESRTDDAVVRPVILSLSLPPPLSLSYPFLLFLFHFRIFI
jgi:hypothetical protein